MTIDPDNRKMFERMGTDAVRIDLLRSFEGNERIPRGTTARQEAVDWLSEQDCKQRRRETRHYWVIVGLTAIAAIAGCIAAWPIIEGWLFPIPSQSTFTIVDPNGRTCQVYPDPKGRKPLAAILGCPETVQGGAR